MPLGFTLTFSLVCLSNCFVCLNLLATRNYQTESRAGSSASETLLVVILVGAAILIAAAIGIECYVLIHHHGH